ncbi:MAG: hypothetical protein N2249_08285 [Melioribacter sp.]|nr:hypothetical protein [Melioribacter sp.]
MIFISIWIVNSYSQVSLDYFGNVSSPLNYNFRLNSIESNVANFSLIKDVELSTTFFAMNDKKIYGSIYALALMKRIGNHNFYLRYTPGINQQFIVKSGVKVQLPDSIAQLKTEIDFQEKFAFGYSFKFLSNFFTGISFRYFTQQFTEEKPILYYTDSIYYINIRNDIAQNNFWRGDIGFTYLLKNKFLLSISSYNLLLAEEINQSELNELYSIKKDKGIAAQIVFYPSERITMFTSYESSGSFYFGVNTTNKLFDGYITIGGTLFHDKYQNPYFAGIQPSINYSTNLFSITLSGIKYFSNRPLLSSLEGMTKYGIHSIINNIYSKDRLFLTFNFALSFIREKSVKFIDVNIKNEIYPTLSDLYLQKPFAYGKVVNLTKNLIEVRPSCLIKEINDDIIYSPSVHINPLDTVEVPFFTVVNKNVDRRKISIAEFYLSIGDEKPDDKIQKPILVNDKNSWDGNVSNLIYFVRYDFDFSSKYAKNILQSYKKFLDTVDFKLNTFYKIKILFENFIKQMNYVADPRSSVEYVQFPSETIKVKGGDCDDLSVCLASIFESIGIQTAFVDYRNDNGISHVNLIVNTGLKPTEMNLITKNDSKVFIRQNENGIDELWIPLEVTSFKDFENAWKIGAEKFIREAVENYGLSTGNVKIIDIY